MGSVDRVEDRTFRVNFSEDGVGRLRERVMDKLKEFMGDYTDDTLVEYVIVLLRNGRRKEEAKNELDVFLGDDSDSFVSWLWDHLSSSLDLYASHGDIDMDKIAETRSSIGAELVGNESHPVDFESKKSSPENISRSRHRREWRDTKHETNEQPLLRSSEVFDDPADDKTRRKVNNDRHSPSPRGSHKKKRSRHDEHQQSKRERETASQATIDVPRRLLQFAVRDAVGTSKASSSVKEPSLKRLRSVVSASTVSASTKEVPLVDRPRRIPSIARVPSGMATAIKAVQQAAEDVTRVKPSRSVFDRLGRDTVELETNKGLAEYRDLTDVEDGYRLKKFGTIGDLLPDEADDVMGMDDQDFDILQPGTLRGSKYVHPSMVHRNVTSNADGVMYNKSLDRSVVAANAARMVANSTSNLNAWRQAHLQPSQDAVRTEKIAQENEKTSGKVSDQIMKENSNPVVAGNGIAKPDTEYKEAQRTSSSLPGAFTGRPTEDVDSRTIFVSNVHFAATKDTLSRHFNKFGEVLKVVILTDAATRQPKGSAYVEFLRKDAADNALALNGTSFMSRILKVVKKSAAIQEDTPSSTPVRPRVARGSPYAVARFSRAPFGRGIPTAFRPRVPVKLGSRSMQWKRGAQGSGAAEAGSPVSASSIRSSAAPRSLTYIRTEAKPEGASATTTTH